VTFTQIAIWPFAAGSGSTIAAAVGGPSIQSFGSTASTPWANPAGKGNGYKTQYNAGPNATGSALILGVHNATRIFAEYTFHTGPTPPANGEVLFGIGLDENSLGNMRIGCWYTSSEIRFRVNGTDVLTGTTGTTLAANTYYRLAVAYDSPNDTGSLRARMWLDEAEISATVTSITQNAAITIDTSTDELVCGAPFGPANVNDAGYSHHLGFWSFDSIDGAAVLSGLANLNTTNDDVEPFTSGGGGSISGSGSGTAAGAAASGSGGVGIGGTGAATASGGAAAGGGTETIGGSGSGAGAGATASGSGSEGIGGGGSAAASGGSSSGAGGLEIAGGGSGTVAPAAAASGGLAIGGSGSGAAGSPTASGSADGATQGTGLGVAAGAAASGSGGVGIGGSGTAAMAPAAGGSGGLAIGGSGAAVARAPTASGADATFVQPAKVLVLAARPRVAQLRSLRRVA
jgi:hypothetical protein